MSKETTTKNPMRIEITQTEKFPKLASTTLETTQRLAKRINKLFSTVFTDYHGSVVYCTAGNGNTAPYQQFMVELHFKPLALGSVDPDDGRVRAFKPIGEKAASDDIVANLKQVYGNFRTSAKFQLTEEASQILSEFMMPGINIDPFKPSTYDALKAEYVDNSTFGQSPIMVKIGQLDLVKLIKKIYGFKAEDGSKVDYGVIPYGPVVPNMNNQAIQNTANWRVMILQIDAEKAFDLATQFGIVPANNGGNGVVITGNA